MNQPFQLVPSNLLLHQRASGWLRMKCCADWVSLALQCDPDDVELFCFFWFFLERKHFWRIKQASGARLFFFEQALIKKSARQKPIGIPQSVSWRAPASRPSPPWNSSLPSPRFHPDSVSPGLCCSVSSSPFWAHHPAELWIFLLLVWFNYVIYICLVWIFVCAAKDRLFVKVGHLSH